MMHPLYQFIQKYQSFSPTDWSKVEDCLLFEDIQKGAHLLKEGQICRYLYFLEEGLLRYYYIKDGLEVTKYFTDAPYLFTAQRSYTKQIPSDDNIQAIENCKVWKITASDAAQLWSIASWSQFIRKLINEVQYFTEEINADLQTENAEDRYHRMLKEEPEFIQRVPQKYLASYLGVAPQSLSRIRKKILEKGRS